MTDDSSPPGYPEGYVPRHRAEPETEVDLEPITDPTKEPGTDSDSSMVSASAWMALGTIVSRLTGFGRSILIIAALGISLNADVFAAANTIPNAMYILVAGGIFNVVLVPQLVRAMRSDDDGGDAYAQRIITLGLLVLAVGTALLIALVPVLMRIVFDARLFAAEFDDARTSAQILMYLCMPQVFFYGAFVLIGQVLNARRRFGPMMWAPIVNNVVSVILLATYIAVFGTSNASDGFSTGEMLLLGIGSTLGIACQTATLLPFLRMTGFVYRPRFDFRGTGLGHTIRLSGWTLLFIIANQIAFIAVQRLGTQGTLEGAEQGEQGSGVVVYELGFLISQVPHGVITVSLATALMPTLSALSAAGDLSGMRGHLDRIVRTALVMIVPIAVLVATLGGHLAVLIGFGGAAENPQILGNTIRAFSIVMIVFCVHFLMLRGFYAHENTRTPFFIQLVIMIVNVGTAITLTSIVEPSRVSMVLALSLGLGYTVGAILSVTILSRTIGPVFGRVTWSFIGRLAIACALFAGTAWSVAWGWQRLDLIAGSTLDAFVLLSVSTGLAGLVYLAAARLLRISELNLLLRTLLRR